MAGPLDGIRVLDFTRVVSGPSCTKALADLGAEVIKLEPPPGDLTRTAQPRIEGIPAYFAQQNAGKRCISVDLGTDAGRDIARRLIDVSDVVVENFRPGVMARHGLDYESVTSTNPSIVYASITGYGQAGPNTERRAYAPMIHAELGLLELTARKRKEPIVNEIASWADLQAGLQTALAVVAALRHREVTGEGQYVDVTMAEVMLQMTEWTAVEWAGGEGDGLAVFGPVHSAVVTLADGSQAVVPGDPVASWPRWLELIERADLHDDPRFVDRPTRAAHRQELMDLLLAWASTVPDFPTLEERIGKAGFAAGRVQTVNDVLDADWAEHRGAVVDIGGDEPLRVPRSPVRFSTLEAGTAGPAVRQGADNETVLVELLDMSPEQVARLRNAGVLVERPRR